MVSILGRFAGLRQLNAIEDIVQETFIQAIQTWKTQAVPDNPQAWLTKVATRKAIDLIRKNTTAQKSNTEYFLKGPNAFQIDELLLDHEIEDSQIWMLFACAHPSISFKDQLVITLKLISGFSHAEISTALLDNVENIKKRFQRAKSFLVSNNIKLALPDNYELKNRTETVLKVIYLIFNEGYNSKSKNQIVRHELCYEAMRLCKFICDKKNIATNESQALMSLMCFHAARLNGRTNEQGELIELKKQNRKLWDWRLIKMGHYFLQRALPDDELFTAYHFESYISAEHCVTKFELTNWKNILSYYDQLIKIKPNDFIQLNRIIVLIQLKEIENASDLFEKLNVENFNQNAYLYFSTAAEINICKGDLQSAKHSLQRAIDVAPTLSEKQFLKLKLNEL